MIWNALILAGSRGSKDPVAQAVGVKHKAFAPLVGKSMIEHVIDALQMMPEIGQIAVSIENDAADLPDQVTRLEATHSPASSVMNALDEINTPLLVTTADNPLIDAASVSLFLEDALACGADIAAGLCPRAIVEQAGNPARRTYLRLRDGQFSGCNLFAFTTPESKKVAEFWLQMEADRKRPWRMASRIGISTLIGYVFGRLDRAGAAKAVSKTSGCQAALLVVNNAYAAHDVDKPEDLAFAEQCLGRGI